MNNYNNPDNLFWKNKKVLLTGHNGFKGMWLLIWLHYLGAEVWGYALKPDNNIGMYQDIIKNLNFSKFHDFIGDINDFDCLKSYIKEINPDIVIHLAAQPLVTDSYLKPLETWQTNVMGTINLIESLRLINSNSSVLIITTDKVYKNNEWEFGYRESDVLGGHDPYSSSKASVELLVQSWRSSFCTSSNTSESSNLKIATARSGNVLGGGDLSQNRIVPDAIRALSNNEIINIRNPNATRPWQHVLEPICGYLLLCEKLNSGNKKYCQAFNFGPNLKSNKKVSELVEKILEYWDGSWKSNENPGSFHEANYLHLNSDKAYKLLNWTSRWDFDKTIKKTVNWYKETSLAENSYQNCLKDIESYIFDD